MSSVLHLVGHPARAGMNVEKEYSGFRGAAAAHHRPVGLRPTLP
jgi:hypothetical protein